MVEAREVDRCNDSTSKSRKRFGMVLSKIEALEIYKCKLQLCAPRSFRESLESGHPKLSGHSVRVASRFGVSPKTVRDIWNRRTWVHVTEDLWHYESPATDTSSRYVQVYSFILWKPSGLSLEITSKPSFLTCYCSSGGRQLRPTTEWRAYSRIANDRPQTTTLLRQALR